MLRSSLKQVVIAGITPFQFIADLLWLARAGLRAVSPDFPLAPETTAGEPNPDSTGTETEWLVHTPFLGKGPFRSGSVTWLPARTHDPAGGSRARLRTGRSSYRREASS